MINDFNKKHIVDVSVIIPCKNEVDNLKSTVDSILQSQNALSFEVIVVDDDSKDQSSAFLELSENKELYKKVTLLKTPNLGAAKARNAGAAVAKGEYLFFCDAHVAVPDQWLDDLVNTLKSTDADIIAPCIVDMFNPLAAGYGQTWDSKLKITWIGKKPDNPIEIPIACGCAFGITKKAFDVIGGFDHLFQVWGKEDEELCFKAWLYGFRTVINPEIKVKHLFRKKHPYQVTFTNVIYNMLCMAYSHFKIERLEKTFQLAKLEPRFSEAVANIQQNFDYILNQRSKYFKERKQDDDFFFNKFNITF